MQKKYDIDYVFNPNFFGEIGLNTPDFLYEEEIDLSIIVPVYNSEKFIIDCLHSALNQETSFVYEVIAVNDGSTDNTTQILNKFAKEYNNLKIINQKNGGISNARNTGILNSRGKYLGFLDNDDRLSVNYVDKLVTLAYKHDSNIVKCGHKNIDIENNKVINSSKSFDFIIEGYLGEKVLELPGFIWSGIYSRNMFENLRFPDGYWFEDIIGRSLLLRLSKKTVFIHDELYFYSLHTDNASKIIWKSDDLKFFDQVVLCNMILEINKKINLPEDNALKRCILWELGPMLYIRSNNSPIKIRKKVFDIIKKDFYDVMKDSKTDNIVEKINLLSYKYQSFFIWRISSRILFEFKRRAK